MPIKHSFIVPCYNEEGNIAAFYQAAVAAMQDYTCDFELIFVNDGSTDGTRAALRQLFDKHPETHLQVIGFSRNFGKEAAMFAGLHAAHGEYITIIDADLQQPPAIAVAMGRLLDEQPDVDMVAAYQSQRHESRRLAWYKRCFYRLINRFSEIQLIPNASDFRTFRRSVAQSLLTMSEYHRFSKGLFSWVGYHTVSLPYEVQERRSGSSKWTFGKLFRYAIDGLTAYTDWPLKLPLYTGGVLTGAAAILLIVLLIVRLCGHPIAAVLTLAALLAFFTGLVLISQGVIGFYLGKIHVQVKQRPLYLIKETLTYEEPNENHDHLD